MVSSSDRGLLNNQILWSDRVNGVGASITDVNSGSTSEIELNVGTADGEFVISQTRQRFQYQPGKSQLIALSTVFQPKENVRQRAGYFDNGDGIFVEQDGLTTNWVIRSSVTGSPASETRVPQSSWNLDKLDGSGPSGVVLNMANAQIFVIDFQWLGTGRVRVGFIMGGQKIYVHQFTHANVIQSPYMGHSIGQRNTNF